MLTLWNTATRSLEAFKPIDPPQVGMYTCGVTVYWDAHIGNMRTYVFEDVLQRTLELEGYEVKRVMNVTDIGELTDAGEDKMLLGAKREGKTVQEVAKLYTDRFLRDSVHLNIVIPKAPYLCKATDHIKEQVELIQTLEEKGFTYVTSDGVYFDTAKFPAYGSFGGQKLSEKEAGARVALNDEKRSQTDFALWKFAPVGSDRQLWPSPWGDGFPGWHIECSAMAKKYLGQPFDIHCGGIDHIPVHHENEIAQSEAAYGVKLANYWLHGEFLLVDGQKMSKSLGNIYILSDIEAKGFDPLALRLLYLGANYRQKQNFTWESLQASQNALNKLRATVREWSVPDSAVAQLDADASNAFKVALENDLNTPVALSVMWKLVDSDASDAVKAVTLRWMDRVLGLSLDAYIGKREEVPSDVAQLVSERDAARAAKNWSESDRLRDAIQSLGWNVEDSSTGTNVRKS